jgi:hypothetical protein
LGRHLRDLDQPAVVFLHARDGLGVAAYTADQKWKQEALNAFLLLLERIRQDRIIFVIMTRAETEASQGQLLVQSIKAAFSDDALCHLPLGDHPFIGYREPKVVQDVAKWLDEGGHKKLKQRFLYAMTLFRHSRHIASLCSWSLMPDVSLSANSDSDEKRWSLGNKWLGELQERGALRHKPGGSMWMHIDLKKSIQEELERTDSEKSERRAQYLRKVAPECHQGIADWYMKLFRSSDDPFAVFESVHHRLESMNNASSLLKQRIWQAPEADRFIVTSMIEAVSGLQLAKERVLACGYFAAYVGLIDVIRGVANEWLESLDATGAQKRVAERLQSVCTQLLRDYYAEVTDYDIALRMHRLLPRDVAPGPPPEVDAELRQRLDDGWRDYREADYRTGLRDYDSARANLLRILHPLGLEVPAALIGRGRVRKMARDWLAIVRSQEELKLAAKALRRYMSVNLEIGRMERVEFDRAQARMDDPPTSAWKYAELMYAMSTEIMRCIDDPAFLQRENTYLRGQYSVILSKLRRYHEAHRRLNEAAGYLHHSAKPYDPVALAVIELRRAEIYLDRAREELGNETGTLPRSRADMRRRRICACVDAAYNSIQRAREGLAGQARDVSWWTWLYELDMSLCVCLARTPSLPSADGRENCSTRLGHNAALPCRECHEAYSRVRTLLDDGSHLVRIDVQRQARLGDMVLRFVAEELDCDTSQCRVPAERHWRTFLLRPDCGNRPRAMLGMLELALERVAAVVADRGAVTDPGGQTGPSVHRLVARYAANVQEDLRKAIERARKTGVA